MNQPTDYRIGIGDLIFVAIGSLFLLAALTLSTGPHWVTRWATLTVIGIGVVYFAKWDPNAERIPQIVVSIFAATFVAILFFELYVYALTIHPPPDVALGYVMIAAALLGIWLSVAVEIGSLPRWVPYFGRISHHRAETLEKEMIGREDRYRETDEYEEERERERER